MKKLLYVLTLTLLLCCVLSSCGNNEDDSNTAEQPTISTSDDGYLVVNGVKTEYQIKTPDQITVQDGYLVVNGVKTTYEVKGDVHSHTFSDWATYNESEPDCEKKLYYRKCSGCSNWEWREGEHSYADLYSFNDSFHWKNCKNCDKVTATEEHTLSSDGLCTICSAALGETEGLVYETSGDGTYAMLVAYEGSAKNIRIADKYNNVPVTIICKNVFANKAITSVTIPKSITNIDDYSFKGCYGLTSITIPDGVTRIGEYAFQFCTNLTSVMIGKNVVSIGDSAFHKCDNLKSVYIPDSVTSIGPHAFWYCLSLTEIRISNNLINVAAYAFPYNTAICTEYEYGRYIGDEENPYKILVSLSNTNMSTYKINENTKVIASSVFSHCNYLTNIVIPNSVTSISDNAFAYCASLTSITLGNSVKRIGKMAFYDSSINSNLADVYYMGNQEEWEKINIESSNDNLTNATIHYNYTPEE